MGRASPGRAAGWPARLLAAALLPALAGVASAAPPDLDAVRELLRKGDRPRALEAARAALADAPDDVDVHLLYQDAARGLLPPGALLGEYKARLEKSPGAASLYLHSRLLPPAEAERVLREAVKADPKAYWAQVGLSSALARLGKGAPAGQAAMAALELRPGEALAAVRCGDLCAAARRFPSAETCYRKALEAGWKGPSAHLGLAHALLRQGRLDEAAAALQAVRDAAKPDPRVLLLEAGISQERGDLAAAEKALVQATTLAPGDQDGIVQLSLLRLKKAEARDRPPGKPVDPKSVSAEVAALEKASGILPERADIRYALGYFHEITGDVDRALDDYREASRLDPLDGAVLVAAGAILANKGAMEEAAQEFTKALDRDPEDAGTMFLLAYALEQQGKPKEALPVYQRLVKTDPKNARGWHALGTALEAAGKPREALTAFQKASELDPKTARHLRDLGEAYFTAKQYRDAEAALAKAVELDPRDDTAWTALARTRSETKNYAGAVEAYQKAADLRPKDKDIHLLLGAYCHEYVKDYAQAIQHYNRYIALGGEAADVEEWIAEAQAQLDRKKP